MLKKKTLLFLMYKIEYVCLKCNRELYKAAKCPLEEEEEKKKEKKSPGGRR